MFSTTDYFNARCQSMKPLCAFDASNEHEARAWRTKAVAKVRDLLGEMPEWTPLQAEVLESVDKGDYVRQKIVFDSDPLSSVPGYLLIPKNLQRPSRALLCLHGHGPGCCAVAGVVEPRPDYSSEQVQQSIEQHNYDYAVQFAKRGYVTLTFDYRCFGERREAGFSLYGRDLCNVHFIRGSVLGINLLALNIHDTCRALDYLCERPEVDPERIGCVGLSFGGTMTLWTAALDKRIKAAVVSGYLSELEVFAVNKGNFCGSQFVPALRRYFDLADIAAMIAPRPLLIESGLNDSGFPIDASRRAFARVQKAYRVYGVPERVEHDVFDGGHQFHGEVAYEWFDKWL
ncbi:MAG: alpha/beta hydrolase family protein [Armatimonadota bacterium]|nr:alpha/beta hydrolase family protein [Armatimonadota bacterium]